MNCNKPLKYKQMHYHGLKGWQKIYGCADGHDIKVGQFVKPTWCNKEVA